MPEQQQRWQQLPVELKMQILSRMELPDLHSFAETSRSNAKLVENSGVQPAGVWYIGVQRGSTVQLYREIDDASGQVWSIPQLTLDAHGQRLPEMTIADLRMLLLKESKQVEEGGGKNEVPWFKGLGAGVVASGSNLACFYGTLPEEKAQLEMVVANPCFPKHATKIRAAAMQPGEYRLSIRLGIHGDSSFYRIVELRETSRLDTWACYHYDSTARRWERSVMKVEGRVMLHQGPCALLGTDLYFVNTTLRSEAAVVRRFNLVTGTLTAVGPCFPRTTVFNHHAMDTAVVCGQEVLLLRVEDGGLSILHIAILRLNPARNQWETVSELPEELLPALNEGRPMIFSLSAGGSDTHLVIHFEEREQIRVRPHKSLSYEMSSGRWMELPKDLNSMELFPIRAKIRAGVVGSDVRGKWDMKLRKISR